MNNSVPLAPVLVAALVSAIVAVAGFWVNRRTLMTLNRDRLDADHKLARRKIDGDLALAKTKFALDLQLVDWTRRSQFAEEVLADFYNARDIFRGARRAFSLGEEGSTRPNRDFEDNNEQLRRDAIYAPYERLNKEREFLSTLHAKRFRAEALFGSGAIPPFFAFVEAHNTVAMATGELLEQFGRDDIDREWTKQLRAEIGWTRKADDPINPKLDLAVNTMEEICRPIIEGRPKLDSMVLGEDQNSREAIA